MPNKQPLLILLSLFCTITHAGPWFTDPLLSLQAETTPRGKVEVYFQVANAISSATYQSDWYPKPEKPFFSTQISPEIAVGLTDQVDFTVSPLYVTNQRGALQFSQVGDTSVMLGYQALKQHANIPDLRITLEEILPSGNYTSFRPINSGVDSTGLGSYQTSLALNFQYLSQLTETHYLNAHFNLGYTAPSRVFLMGLNTFGGSPETKGWITPGDTVGVDLAGELSLTQQWVAVMEVNYIYQNASVFSGTRGVRDRTKEIFPNRHNIGSADVGSDSLAQFSLAPALEFNMSADFGVIAGVWFSVAGKNAPQFVTPVIQLNGTW